MHTLLNSKTGNSIFFNIWYNALDTLVHFVVYKEPNILSMSPHISIDIHALSLVQHVQTYVLLIFSTVNYYNY